MLFRNTNRLLRRFSQLTSKTDSVPVAPKLYPGELDVFRFRRENERLYEGYSEQELFGVKIGIKHSPSMRAQMMKYFLFSVRDNIAASLIFIVGVGLVIYNHMLFVQDFKNYQRYIQADLKVDDAIFNVPPLLSDKRH